MHDPYSEFSITRLELAHYSKLAGMPLPIDNQLSFHVDEMKQRFYPDGRHYKPAVQLTQSAPLFNVKLAVLLDLLKSGQLSEKEKSAIRLSLVALSIKMYDYYTSGADVNSIESYLSKVEEGRLSKQIVSEQLDTRFQEADMSWLFTSAPNKAWNRRKHMKKTEDALEDQQGKITLINKLFSKGEKNYGCLVNKRVTQEQNFERRQINFVVQLIGGQAIGDGDMNAYLTSKSILGLAKKVWEKSLDKRLKEKFNAAENLLDPSKKERHDKEYWETWTQKQIQEVEKSMSQRQGERSGNSKQKALISTLGVMDALIYELDAKEVLQCDIFRQIVDTVSAYRPCLQVQVLNRSKTLRPARIAEAARNNIQVVVSQASIAGHDFLPANILVQYEKAVGAVASAVKEPGMILSDQDILEKIQSNDHSLTAKLEEVFLRWMVQANYVRRHIAGNLVLVTSDKEDYKVFKPLGLLQGETTKITQRGIDRIARTGFTGLIGRCKFENTTFTNTSFTKQELLRTEFFKSSLDGGAFTRCIMPDTTFSQSAVESVNFENCRIGPPASYGNEDSIFSRGATFKQVVFDKCKMPNAKFLEAESHKGPSKKENEVSVAIPSTFSNTTFKDSDLSAANFRAATLTDTTFTNCDLSSARLEQATLSNTTFVGCQLPPLANFAGTIYATPQAYRALQLQNGVSNLQDPGAQIKRCLEDYCDYGASSGHARGEWFVWIRVMYASIFRPRSHIECIREVLGSINSDSTLQGVQRNLREKLIQDCRAKGVKIERTSPLAEVLRKYNIAADDINSVASMPADSGNMAVSSQNLHGGTGCGQGIGPAPSNLVVETKSSQDNPRKPH